MLRIAYLDQFFSKEWWNLEFLVRCHSLISVKYSKYMSLGAYLEELDFDLTYSQELKM
jgi:hypothetical protein